MSWTPGDKKFDCPTCSNTVGGISLVLDFAFIEGVRHRTTESWVMKPCEHLIQDCFADWLTDETEEGSIFSALVEKDTDKVLLAWQEQDAEVIGCDCDDCEGECQAWVEVEETDE